MENFLNLDKIIFLFSLKKKNLQFNNNNKKTFKLKKLFSLQYFWFELYKLEEVIIFKIIEQFFIAEIKTELRDLSLLGKSLSQLKA